MNSSYQQTALHSEHLALGAKMMPFGGFDMPLHYGSQLDEHHAVRKNVGLFDVGHMGVIRTHHLKAYPWLWRSPEALIPYQIQYNQLLLENQTVVDDVLIYREADEDFLVVNAGNRQADFDFLKQMGIRPEWNPLQILALQGPHSLATLEQALGLSVSTLKYYHFNSFAYEDFALFISRTGYTGEDGFEIYFDPKHALLIWNKLVEQGATPCGLAARDTLRMEAGMPLYGHELDTAHVAQDFFKLYGMVIHDRKIPRQGFKVLNQNGDQVGEVTSGSFSPTLEKPIAIVRLNEKPDLSQNLWIEIRNEKIPGQVQKLPFYKRMR